MPLSASVAQVDPDYLVPAIPAKALVRTGIREMQDLRFVTSVWLNTLNAFTTADHVMGHDANPSTHDMLLHLRRDIDELVVMIDEAITKLQSLMCELPKLYIQGLINEATDGPFLIYELVKPKAIALVDQNKRRRTTMWESLSQPWLRSLRTAVSTPPISTPPILTPPILTPHSDNNAVEDDVTPTMTPPGSVLEAAEGAECDVSPIFSPVSPLQTPIVVNNENRYSNVDIWSQMLDNGFEEDG